MAPRKEEINRAFWSSGCQRYRGHVRLGRPKTDQTGVQKIATDGRPVWACSVLAQTDGERMEVIENAIPSLTDMNDNLVPFQPAELRSPVTSRGADAILVRTWGCK